MKPLILILLAAVWTQAQSIADLARQERARQARARSARVFAIVYTANPAPEAEGAPKEAAAPAAAPAAEPEATKPEVDPVQQWNTDTTKLRESIRGLLDQEMAAQLEINTLTNSVTAPVTSQTARNQAQTQLEAAQTRLTTIREALEKNRGELQQREAQGPPRK